MSSVGVSVPRVDGLAKVTGTARYSVDVQMPGMLHVCAVRSPYPHAKVVSIDTAPAERLPGVVVLTRADLGSRPYFGPVLMDESIVAVDKVRFCGEIVAAVAAPSPSIAEEAASLVTVEYEELPPVLDPLAALDPSSPVLHERLHQEAVSESRSKTTQPGIDTVEGFAEGNVCSRSLFKCGDTDSGFAEAERIFEDVYEVPPIQHSHLEPHSATAYWEGPRLNILCASQDPWVVRSEMAGLFGLLMSQVRVTVPYVGGGFGAKLYPRIEPVVAALSRKANRPVSWTLTREEEFLTITRHGARVFIKTGVRNDGSMTAREVRVVYDAGAYAEISPRVGAQNAPVATGPYRVGNVSVECLTVYTCKPPAGAFRGFGIPQIAWAYESQMDDIARELDIDPLELRRRNLYREGELYVTGEPLVSLGVAQCLERVAAGVDPESLKAKDRRAQHGVVRGVGVACSLKSTMTPSVSAASLRLDADASLLVSTSAAEIGQGSTTVLAQIAAESLGLPVQNVHVSLPDTDFTPFDHGTKSSRTTFSVGNAVSSAAADIRRQLLELASGLLEAPPAILEVRHGAVGVKGGGASVSIPEIFRQEFGLAVGNLHASAVYKTEGGVDPVTYKGKDSAFWASGAALAEVEVDLETGKVKIVRLVTAVDTGKALNPAQCRLQSEGAATMALGASLMEEMVFDRGQLINGSFTSYPVPSIADFPTDFESHLIEVPHPEGPFGAKGMGETLLPAVAPAIGNAVANALGGRRVKSLPLRPDKVLQIIMGGEL